MTERTFIISGIWENGRPEYSLYEYLPKPKYLSPMWHEDQRWRPMKMPRFFMRQAEIITWLKREFGKDCRMCVREFRNPEKEIFITFTEGGEKL